LPTACSSHTTFTHIRWFGFALPAAALPLAPTTCALRFRYLLPGALPLPPAPHRLPFTVTFGSCWLVTRTRDMRGFGLRFPTHCPRTDLSAFTTLPAVLDYSGSRCLHTFTHHIPRLPRTLPCGFTIGCTRCALLYLVPAFTHGCGCLVLIQFTPRFTLQFGYRFTYGSCTALVLYLRFGCAAFAARLVWTTRP